MQEIKRDGSGTSTARTNGYNGRFTRLQRSCMNSYGTARGVYEERLAFVSLPIPTSGCSDLPLLWQISRCMSRPHLRLLTGAERLREEKARTWCLLRAKTERLAPVSEASLQQSPRRGTL